MSNNIKIVIGSWGSYNECNERALGSKWLDLSDYSDWDEIVEELKNEGFELDGIDEELFIQDIEGIEDRSVNWDYVNPETLFNTLKESGVLDDDYIYFKDILVDIFVEPIPSTSCINSSSSMPSSSKPSFLSSSTISSQSE